ncbi:acyltransferase family protein [Salinibacterium hongtaonis]|uniref:acyltransferase family protein n=1 Tax=Homoserinimonas hongtaonis TaxID=2079791 RepID=UPI001F542E34|nr:acyltransferase family protein [Salinibacterium hongtaonis]
MATRSIAAGGRPRVRVPLWDNARFIAVTLVVVGHGIQRQMAESDVALVIYLAIYTFHMPAFAIISGYFSKSAPPGERQMVKVITDILLPYFIMETIWTVVKLLQGTGEVNPTTPSWTLWFLLALGIFRLILPYLALLKWPLLLAIAVSVGVGYFANVDNTLSLSRAFGILPFFVLGWRLREWGLVDRWRFATTSLWWARSVAIALFAALITVLAVYADLWREIDLRFWLFYDESYSDLGGQWWSGFVRLALIALAVLFSAAFFVLVPRSTTAITKLGQGTMYVYLLHSFVLYPLRESTFLRDHSSVPWIIATIVGCVLLSVVLASKPVRRVFRPLVEPRPTWLFRSPPSHLSGESRIDPTGSRRDGVQRHRPE